MTFGGGHGPHAIQVVLEEFQDYRGRAAMSVSSCSARLELWETRAEGNLSALIDVPFHAVGSARGLGHNQVYVPSSMERVGHGQRAEVVGTSQKDQFNDTMPT